MKLVLGVASMKISQDSKLLEDVNGLGSNEMELISHSHTHHPGVIKSICFKYEAALLATVPSLRYPHAGKQCSHHPQ